jgi:beta-fructofuranosidase
MGDETGMLILPDRWLWDFWLARDGRNYHLFYLQAPRWLGDPERRHGHASIGHAVSTDLHNWQCLPDALAPGLTGSWDDCATWTGSVIRHDGLWYLFYTGTCRAEDGVIQRIGLATSADLVHWQKHPANPILTADPRWYELLDRRLWHDQAWRDPYVFPHPNGGTYHALITTRANHGPADGRGVIGHARSKDLVHWDVLPPLTEPGDFGHMEVPQWVGIDGRYYLLFCCQAEQHAAVRQQRTGTSPTTSTYYLMADQPLGPFGPTGARRLAGDAQASRYAGKLVEGPGGRWFLLEWLNFAADGSFIGVLGDPRPVEFDSLGHMHLADRVPESNPQALNGGKIRWPNY